MRGMCNPCYQFASRYQAGPCRGCARTAPVRDGLCRLCLIQAGCLHGPVPAPWARGHFPSEQAALKCLYLVTRSLDPTGAGRTRWTMRWKPVINAFAITFGDRWPAAETH